MRVRILGGGVAGLACAIALRRRAGIADVHVFEREATASLPERLGHGLILMQNGEEALRALGVESLLEGCTKLNRALLQNERGLAIHSEPMTNVYCLTRAQIVSGLRSALPPRFVSFNREALQLDVDPPLGSSRRRLRSIEFRAGTPLRDADADLFVGAEGARSPLCDALNPGLSRPASRVLEIVTSTHLPDLAAQLGSCFVKTVFHDRGLAFGLLAPTAERVIGFLQLDGDRYRPPAPPATPADYQRFLLELLADAPEPVPTYLRQADFETAHLWRPANADLPAHLHCDNAVILGDAAHPLLPFTSQGVGAALEDAIILADLLQPIAADPALLPGVLAGFCGDRRRDLAAFVEGGRRILESFLDASPVYVAPYVDGASSRIEEHLTLPRGGLRALFRALDRNGDQLLDREEFRQGLEIFELGLSTQESEALFDVIDANGDGGLTIDELLAALGGDGGPPLLEQFRARLSPRRVQIYAREARCRSLFRRMDADGDGYIDASEFGRTLLFLGIEHGPEAWRALFAELDSDGDGRIDLAELFEGIVRGDATPELAALSARVVAYDNPVQDPLFADTAVDLTVLRARAFNHRWAVVPADTIPLTAADSDFPVAPAILEAIQEYTAAGYLSYGPAEGLPELREVATETIRERRRINCVKEQVFVTDGAASALFLVARFAITKPGQEAIIADPVDFLFERSVVAAGGTVRRLPLRRELGYSFDVDELESLVRPGKTRLLSICNPHNPLGRVWSRRELETLGDLAVRHNLWILSDEVWADIVYAPSALTSTASLGGEIARRTFTVFGFSKSYGLAGLRLGLLVSPTPEVHRAMVGLSHANETAYGVSTLSQVAGLAAYRSAGDWLDRFLQHLRGQRDYAVERLNRMNNVRCHAPEGTFVVLPDVSALNRPLTLLVAELRDRHKVVVVPGSPAFFGPGAAGHLRLSFATSRLILSQGLDRLEAGLAVKP